MSPIIKSIAVLSSLSFAVLSSMAQGILNTGGITPLTGSTGGGGTIVSSGTLLGQQLIQISSPTGGNDGTIDSWVLSGVSGNPYPGGLTFIYQIQNLAGSPVENVALSGFGGLSSIDVEQIAAYGSPLTGLGTGTIFANQGTFLGGVVTLQALTPNGTGLFGTPAGLPTGAISDYILINTSATTFGRNVGQIQDGFTASGSILSPVSVPEPSTMMLSGIGGLGVLLLRRRK